MGSLERRIGAVEEYINARVEERLEEELRLALARLEEKLPREEAVRVMRILAGKEVEHGA
jgi:hypothetical protein